MDSDNALQDYLRAEIMIELCEIQQWYQTYDAVTEFNTK